MNLQVMKMFMCPLCNGFYSEMPASCPNCKTLMMDHGKITDYLDEYSAYMEIETMKLFDGATDSLEAHHCIHLFSCSNCLHEEVLEIQE
jgi:transcription elongation factor Elf1